MTSRFQSYQIEFGYKYREKVKLLSNDKTTRDPAAWRDENSNEAIKKAFFL